MKLSIAADRLIVISDLHVGNPHSLASANLGPFLDYVVEEDFSLVINGDGLDILQGRFKDLATQSLVLADGLRRVTASGRELHYVIGNHDMVLESVLGTWIEGTLAPFLNVVSGRARIRIEHGHVYDPFFAFSPRLYEAAGRACAPLLALVPDVYKVWSGTTQARARMKQLAGRSRRREVSPELAAADMLASRGFDLVVFGHTHRPEVRRLPSGGHYVNSGNWLRDRTFVRIIEGEAELLEWNGQPEPLTAAGP